MHSKAKKSPYGLNKDTLIDLNVRDTYEIDSKNIKLEFNLDETLKTIKDVLAPASKSITAEFYKLLIYEKGSHFKKHKDTLRSKNHFGTLLLNYHVFIKVESKECFQFSLEKGDNPFNSVKWLAFFTDCDHEILPLESGFRVALTFHLLFQGKKPVIIDDETLAKGCNLVEKAFQESKGKDIGFILHHKYSSSTLAPENLKGKDLLMYHLVESLPGYDPSLQLFSKRTMIEDGNYNEEELESCVNAFITESDEEEIRENETYHDHESFQGNYGPTDTYEYEAAFLVISAVDSDIEIIEDFPKKRKNTSHSEESQSKKKK
eukprot:gene12700-6898_t